MKFKLFITMRTTTSTLFLPKIFWFMREWWDLNYKCFSISFDDEDIYGDNGNAFDDDGDNDNEDAFFDTIFVTFKIVNLIAGIQSNHKLCINSKTFYFFAFFWLAPLGGVIGRPELRPPYGNFFLSAGWRKRKMYKYLSIYW